MFDKSEQNLCGIAVKLQNYSNKLFEMQPGVLVKLQQSCCQNYHPKGVLITPLQQTLPLGGLGGAGVTKTGLTSLLRGACTASSEMFTVNLL